mmetsp:Transcript_35015/g.69167  ORF Transcript_35015/g.69167 Transcript_35015/m.69167 type:complete len:98 (+) Transcript_35015:138-431(+)
MNIRSTKPVPPDASFSHHDRRLRSVWKAMKDFVSAFASIAINESTCSAAGQSTCSEAADKRLVLAACSVIAIMAQIHLVWATRHRDFAQFTTILSWC